MILDTFIADVRDYLLSIRRKHAMIWLSVVVGMASGLVAVALKNGVFAIRYLLTNHLAIDKMNWLFVVYPIIGIGITWLIIKRLLRGKHPGPGIPTTLQAIARRRGQMKRQQTYASVITSVFTVGFGGSAGLEAPAVQACAGIGSNLTAALNMNYKTRTLMIGCAAAGSLAAMFKAPVAAIVFAVEVIMIDLTTASMVPLLMASLSALLTSSLLIDESQLLSTDRLESFQMRFLPFYILLGVASGIAATYFNRIYLGIIRRMQGMKSLTKRLLLGGSVMGVLLFFFPPLYGEGYDVLNAFLRDDLREVTLNSVFYELPLSSWALLLFLFGLLLLKAVATSITLGAGGVGGIFAPTLFMGGTLGFLYSKLVSRVEFFGVIPTGSFTLLGMAGLMAGVLHAPLTSIFMIAEISGGYQLFVPLMFTSGIAYYTSRIFNKHTIYTAELAERGELITHNKDQAVLTLMNLQDEVERDFTTVSPDKSLRELVEVVKNGKRNVFPVLDFENRLMGIITLDDLRPIMFNTELYDEINAGSIMTLPPEIIRLTDRMDAVVKKFDESGAWNLPVVDDDARYVGMVSKSRLFTAYRKVLVDVSNT
ncbi:MAG: chloride channel protein [Flavobacteriales bacterium]